MAKAILEFCMDPRHENIEDAIREMRGNPNLSFYGLRDLGGAGRSELYPDQQAHIFKQADAALKLGATEWHIVIHGAGEHDPNGCGAYILNGYGDNYETPERSQRFSVEQLKRAAKIRRTRYPDIPIFAYYATFKPIFGTVKHINILEPVVVMEETPADMLA